MQERQASIDGRRGPRAGAAERRGRARADAVARRIGTGLKEARLAQGLRQVDAASAAGITQPHFSRIERGQGARRDAPDAVRMRGGAQRAACGVRRGDARADLPRDIEHLRRQNLVVATAQAGGWTAIPEATLDEGRWSRSIDVLLSRAARREAAVVEIWDLLARRRRGDAGPRGEGPGAARAARSRMARARPAPRPRRRTGTGRSCGSCVTCSARPTRRPRGPGSVRSTDAGTPMPRGGWFRLDQRGWHRLVVARL